MERNSDAIMDIDWEDEASMTAVCLLHSKENLRDLYLIS
jgi:hypothetical protein